MKQKATFSTPLFILVIYALLIGAHILEKTLIDSGGNLYLTVIILEILIFIIPSIIFCRLKGMNYSTKLNIKLFSPDKFGITILTSLTAILGSIVIRLLQINFGGMTEFGFSMFETYLSLEEDPVFLFTVMAFSVMPAIAEEFVFRTIVLTEYNEAGLGAVTASIISSLLSSMMFFDLGKLPIFFFAGIMFCALTYATGSSLCSVLCHILFSIYGIFGEKYVVSALLNPPNKIIGVFTFTLLFLVIAAITFGEYEHVLKKMGYSGAPSPSYKLKKSDDGTTPDISATEAEEEGLADPDTISAKTGLSIEAFFSPTFLLCLLVFAIAIFGLFR